MARSVGVAGIRKAVICATTLLIKAQRINPRKPHGDAILDQERQRSAQSRHLQAIFTWRLEAGEIRHVNFLIRSWFVIPTDIRPRDQSAFKDFCSGGRINQGELRRAWNVHLAKSTNVISDHGLLGYGWNITFLIDVNRGAEAQRTGRRRKVYARRP